MADSEKGSSLRPIDPEVGQAGDKPTDKTLESGPESGAAAGRSTGDASVSLVKFASLGLELAVSTLLFGGLGYWLDQSRGHGYPVAGGIGVLFGFTLGMYRLIVATSQES